MVGSSVRWGQWLFFFACLNAAASADTSALKSIRACMQLVIDGQVATKHFLLVALGDDLVANQNHFDSTVSGVSRLLADLSAGNSDRGILTPPSAKIRNILDKVNQDWANYKVFLSDKVDTVTDASFSIIAGVVSLNKDLLTSSEDLLAKYLHWAQFEDEARPSETERYASDQLKRIQRMMQDIVLIRVGVDTDASQQSLADLGRSFGSTHNQILAEDFTVCKIHQTSIISAAWDAMTETLESTSALRGADKAADDLVRKLETQCDALQTALESLTSLLEEDDGSCELLSKISEQEWHNILSEIQKQRESTQRASSLFFQLAFHNDGGIGTDRLKSQFEDSLQEARSSLESCRKGSHSENIPGPPLQTIADELKAVDDVMAVFAEETTRSVDAGAFQKAAVSRVAAHSSTLLNNMNSVALLYVRSALQAMPTLNSFQRELSGQQLTRLQKIMKELLLVVLDVDLQKNTAALRGTIGSFESAHQVLLMGQVAITNGSDEAAFQDQAMPRTTDACTLDQMASALQQFSDLTDVVGEIVNGSYNSSEVRPKISEAQAINDLVVAKVTTATNSYTTGAGSCEPKLSVAEWEAVLDNAGGIPARFQEALMNYYLIVSDYSNKWMTKAAADLVDHRGYIGIEAADPELVTAIEDFTRAWGTYRETDEERAVALQAAYITLNPHPLGEKHMLDFADGPEEYHEMHKKYHPKYRTTLLERNYYDIFMFDAAGNLIYSVYKELDYATNFLANGTGEWKDSGLGEAFRAAMQNPDIISVIDWKPYGPSYGALASFLSTGVRDAKRKLIGVFCTQMPPEAKPIDAVEGLSLASGEIHAIIMRGTYGRLDELIRPPPTPAISAKVFAVGDSWHSMALKETSSDKASAMKVAEKDSSFMQTAADLLSVLVDDAWLHAPTLEGTKIVVAYEQVARLQSMCKMSVLLNMNGFPVTRKQLGDEIQAFETTHDLLMDGRKSRTPKTDIAATVDSAIRAIMQETYGKWEDLKQDLTSTAQGDTTEQVLRNVVEKTRDVVTSMNKAVTYWSTTTRTTTLMVIEILAPVPLTGGWAGGQTMRTSAMLAEAQINADQRILPGFNLKTVFFDDKCDARTSSDTVLTELSAKSTYIGLGGAGCSDVCAQTAYAASTMKLPYLSYECPAAALSNQDVYSDLTRFGTDTSPGIKAIASLGDKHGWTTVTVVAGNEKTHGTETQEIVSALRAEGFRVSTSYADETKWESIVSMMSTLKEQSKGKKRIFFVVGFESYYRKLLCASIVTGMRKGITWLSVGTWREDWWSKSDAVSSFHVQWLAGDVDTRELRRAFVDFKLAWAEWMTDASRRAELQGLYRTDELDKLMFIEGPEKYHAAHKQWHPLYRKTLYDRAYYDIFFFDLEGNLIYSVYKESDYATNFELSSDGPWKDSGLGDAYRAAKLAPDNISYIDWAPYGPSAYKDAAFLSTGLRSDDGELIGVYCIQLPPEYERSIELLQEECTLNKMAESFEGAINIAGAGRPETKNMEKPLPCFKGQSAASFIALLDTHLKEGYPRGTKATQVPDPYHLIKGHAADATCVFAFTVRHLLDEGYTMEQIQRPSEEVYDKFLNHIKTGIDFHGVSGRVKFDGNDRPNNLVVQQVQDGSKVDVGIIDTGGTLTWTAPVQNASWTEEIEDPPADFPHWAFQAFIPTLIVVCPALCGIRKGIVAQSDINI